MTSHFLKIIFYDGEKLKKPLNFRSFFEFFQIWRHIFFFGKYNVRTLRDLGETFRKSYILFL